MYGMWGLRLEMVSGSSSSPSYLASPGCSPISEVQDPTLCSQWSLLLLNPVGFLSYFPGPLRNDPLTQHTCRESLVSASLARALSVYAVPIKASVCSSPLQNHRSHGCPGLQLGHSPALCLSLPLPPLLVDTSMEVESGQNWFLVLMF